MFTLALTTNLRRMFGGGQRSRIFAGAQAQAVAISYLSRARLADLTSR